MPSRLPAPLATLWLAACGAPKDGGSPAEAGDPQPADSGAGVDADTGPAPPAPRVAPAYSGEACPEISSDRVDFPTGGGTRSVRFVLPPEPAGAPVVFAWHWLGGSPSEILDEFDLEALAAEEGVIVVAPASDGSAYEWHFLDPAEGNPDLLLFDDLLACLHGQLSVDLDRIWATGMSAGGLWSSYLLVHRAQHLSAVAPFSGGLFPGFYEAPADPIPTLLTWGGPSDTYGALEFEPLNIELSAALRADGHFVAECVHDRGHRLPADPRGLYWPFFEAHPWGITEEPWAGGLPEGWPEWCRLP
jgi:dienelactone hydrolase